ncbi:MAG: hypothetical protein A2636_05340 [Elusimicrobia bacterium RIFCSPHIGHO2_01_FULL_64_10]|nr:MAG: hypothetical protein A2636_05340 [Elusimicrobia bacterium RIFCSPHIGHO2_01_FULL_64_10]
MKDLLAYRHRVMSGGEVVGMLSISRQVQGIFFGSLFVLGLGMWDDRFKVPAGVKLPLQIIAAYIAMDFGLRLSGISHPWRGHYIAFPLIASQVITVAWLTGFMNTVNLADGLDGLAAGISAIAAATFLAVALLQSQTGVVFFSKQLNLASVLSAAVCGASLGFLWFNFHPARVFMGDGGALFLGFMLASVTVIGTLKTAAFISFVIPILVVALPVLDVAFSILRRLRSGRDVFRPDRDHLHHRLLRHGWSQREVVLGIYVITLVLSGAAVVLTALKGRVG